MTTDKPKLPRPAASPDAELPRMVGGKSGRVQFDDRGNAIWEWSVSTGAFGRDVSNERLRRLEHPALSVVDDTPKPAEAVKTNLQGTVRGYDPYDSGRLGKKAAPRPKKDLRRLSEWITLKKRVEKNKDGVD